MKIRDEKIEVKVNDKVVKTTHLHRGTQRACFYWENADIAAEKAQGKTKPQAKADEITRKTTAFFNAAVESLNELIRLDVAAADTLLAELYGTFSIANETKPGGGTNLKTLEERAAAIFFAWQDAEYCVELQTGIPHVQTLANICFDVNDDYIHGRIEANARAREAIRRFRAINDESGRESRRELSPEGCAIFEALEAASAALDQCVEDGGPDEDEKADKIMEAAEAPLDALALKDPEEATRIFKRSSYFDEMIEENEIYLGARVFCRRDELKKLETPEKRAAYIETGEMPEVYDTAQ